MCEYFLVKIKCLKLLFYRPKLSQELGTFQGNSNLFPTLGQGSKLINTSRLADTSCLGQLLTVFPVAVIVFFELLLAFNIVVLSYSLLFLVNVPSYGHLQERCILISPCFCLNWCTLGPQQPTQCCSPRSRGGWSSRSSAE